MPGKLPLRRLPIVAVVGAGRMGRGLAQTFAYAGHHTILIDLKDRPSAEAKKLEAEALAEIDSSLAMLAELGAFDPKDRAGIMQRIGFASRLEAPRALAGADVAFEGVPETLEAKRDALRFACVHLKPDAILASTTSSMLVTELAGFVTHPARFLNAHWLNPAYLVPLVELSPHPATSPETLARLQSMLEAIGKVPVICSASPGYIVPRFQSLVMNEAARLVEQGLASPEDIDRAVRFGFGFRYATMGVIEFIDYGGLDILYFAARYLETALGDPRYAAPEIIRRYMDEGRIGLKSGRGFFDYSGMDVAAYRRDVIRRQLSMLNHLELARKPGAALSKPRRKPRG